MSSTGEQVACQSSTAPFHWARGRRAENLGSHAHLAPWAVPEPGDPWRPCFPHPGDGKTLMAWAARIRQNQVFEGLGEAQVTWPCGLGFVDVFAALSCLLEPCMRQATSTCLNG